MKWWVFQKNYLWKAIVFSHLFILLSKENLKKIHFKKIELSDAIFVINKDKYIGESINLEIEYAKKLGKEILYLE